MRFDQQWYAIKSNQTKRNHNFFGGISLKRNPDLFTKARLF